jgi:adenine deaminase
LLGRADSFGAVQPGLAADLVVLDENLEVQAVVAGGEWVRRGGADGAASGIDAKLVQTNDRTGLDH